MKFFFILLIFLLSCTYGETKKVTAEQLKTMERYGIFLGYGAGNFMIGDTWGGVLYLFSDLLFLDGGIAMIITGSVLKTNSSDTIITMVMGFVFLALGIGVRVLQVKDISSYARRNDLLIDNDERRIRSEYSWSRAKRINPWLLRFEI